MLVELEQPPNAARTAASSNTAALHFCRAIRSAPPVNVDCCATIGNDLALQLVALAEGAFLINFSSGAILSDTGAPRFGSLWTEVRAALAATMRG
jgi:hypothetical protein